MFTSAAFHSLNATRPNSTKKAPDLKSVETLKEALLVEHVYEGHHYVEGENFKDEFGSVAPHIAIIKNDTGTTTGEGLNSPNNEGIMMAYKFANRNGEGVSVPDIGIVHHTINRDGTANEHWMHFTLDQIAHLARHAGLKISEE